MWIFCVASKEDMVFLIFLGLIILICQKPCIENIGSYRSPHRSAFPLDSHVRPLFGSKTLYQVISIRSRIVFSSNASSVSDCYLIINTHPVTSRQISLPFVFTFHKTLPQSRNDASNRNLSLSTTPVPQTLSTVIALPESISCGRNNGFSSTKWVSCM